MLYNTGSLKDPCFFINKHMRIQLILRNELGEFRGEHLDVSKDQSDKIINMSKKFYESGFEMFDEDGGFLVFPPEIVKKSILEVRIIETD